MGSVMVLECTVDTHMIYTFTLFEHFWAILEERTIKTYGQNDHAVVN